MSHKPSGFIEPHSSTGRTNVQDGPGDELVKFALRVASDQRLTGTDLRVYLMLVAAGDRWVGMTQRLIAHGLQLGLRNTSRSLQHLALLGYIEHRAVAGQRYRHAYRINTPRIPKRLASV